MVNGKYTRLLLRRQGFRYTGNELPEDNLVIIFIEKMKLNEPCFVNNFTKTVRISFIFCLFFIFLRKIFISSSYQLRAIKSTIYWRAKNWSLACFYYREHYTTYNVLHKYRHTQILAGNYGNHKKWVLSTLLHNLRLISMGIKLPIKISFKRGKGQLISKRLFSIF